MKLNLMKFNEIAGKLVMDLNEWWSKVSSFQVQNFGTYSKKIDKFIETLEILRSKELITFEEEVKDIED